MNNTQQKFSLAGETEQEMTMFKFKTVFPAEFHAYLTKLLQQLTWKTSLLYDTISTYIIR